MLYFAYGSNMSVARLTNRISGVERLGLYMLAGHELLFHKIGKDKSAKCDAFFTGSNADIVYGVLYDFPRTEKYHLDLFEGLGAGYEQKVVSVTNESGQTKTPFIYYATAIDPSLPSFSWYKYHVLHGAEEAEVPQWYLGQIRATPEMVDPDRERRDRELAIYNKTI